jgi:hypothetical protein
MYEIMFKIFILSNFIKFALKWKDLSTYFTMYNMKTNIFFET